MGARAFWDKTAKKYARAPISDPEGYQETLGRIRARLKPDHHVLEVGCGTGSTAIELAGDVAAYTATDVSPAMIEIARAKPHPPSLKFETGMADAPPSGPFDVILALNLLHLVEDLDKALAALAATLKPGGLLISKTALLGAGPWYIRAAIPPMRALGKAPFVSYLDTDMVAAAHQATGLKIVETLDQSGMVPRHFCIASKG